MLRALKETAADVNAYRLKNGVLPDTVEGNFFGNEGYHLIISDDQSSYLVVADREFIDDDGSRIQWACDDKLKFRKLRAGKTTAR